MGLGDFHTTGPGGVDDKAVTSDRGLNPLKDVTPLQSPQPLSWDKAEDITPRIPHQVGQRQVRSAVCKENLPDEKEMRQLQILFMLKLEECWVI